VAHQSSSSSKAPVSWAPVCTRNSKAKEYEHPMSQNGQANNELQLLLYWVRLRPVARIQLASVSQRRLCRALRAAWTLMRMQGLGRYDLFGCRGCGEFPTEATCIHCATRWCELCAQWSPACWKCYRPRPFLNDCGEFMVGWGGPAGDGSLEPPLGAARRFADTLAQPSTMCWRRFADNLDLGQPGTRCQTAWRTAPGSKTAKR
jgi:hypothetical protein